MPNYKYMLFPGTSSISESRIIKAGWMFWATSVFDHSCEPDSPACRQYYFSSEDSSVSPSSSLSSASPASSSASLFNNLFFDLRGEYGNHRKINIRRYFNVLAQLYILYMDGITDIQICNINLDGFRDITRQAQEFKFSANNIRAFRRFQFPQVGPW